MCSAFLWSGSPHTNTKSKVGWEEICTAKEEGGLSLRRIHEVSRVFGFGLIWKIVSNTGSLWVAWVRHYLIRQGTFWDAKDSTLGSWQWRKLLKLRSQAAPFLVCRLGDGRNTFFWLDYWHPRGRLIDIAGVTGICNLGVKRLDKVCDVVSGSAWNLRHSRKRAMEELTDQIRETRVLDTNAGKDETLWRHATDVYRDFFSSAATWEQICTRKEVEIWHRIIWFPQGVPRFAFTSWLAIKDRLSTGARMRNWGITQNCLLCGELDENQDHLFFACPYSFMVWLKTAGGLLQGEADPDWDVTIQTLGSRSNKGNNYILIRLVFQATIYHIWRERNERKHNQKYRMHYQLAKVIDKTIRSRLLSLAYYDNRKLQGIMQLWFASRCSG